MVPQAFSSAWGTTNSVAQTPASAQLPPSDDGHKPAPSPREAKLAQALRANLRRRKAGAAFKATAPPKPKSVDET